eukprot:7378074-Prymnesium_polylepis.2
MWDRRRAAEAEATKAPASTAEPTEADARKRASFLTARCAMPSPLTASPSSPPRCGRDSQRELCDEAARRDEEPAATGSSARSVRASRSEFEPSPPLSDSASATQTE